MPGFIKLPKIGALRHVIDDLGSARPKLTYRPKIKLHGTNSGVRIEPDGTVVAQSRTRDLVDGLDNAGFAAWVRQHEEVFSDLRTDVPVVIFGEWAGPGIQKHDAVTQISEKSWFVFAAVEVQEDNKLYWITDPFYLDLFYGNEIASVGGRILPWYDGQVELDLGGDLSAWADETSEVVEAIGRRDPYISEVFGVDGPGEGLVFFPLKDKGVGSFRAHPHTGRLLFKAKASAHTEVKVKDRKAISVDPVVLGKAEEFAAAYVTDARCEKGVAEVGGIDLRKTGAFMRWINNDIMVEGARDLEANGLSWKDVGKVVNARASSWYTSRAKGLI